MYARISAATPSWLLPLVLAVWCAAGPWLGLSSSWQTQIILVAILTLVVSGFNLGFGYIGELSLGQVALYAVGAYIGGIMQVHELDLSLALLASAAAAALLGLVIAIPGIRLGGWGLAMMSFLLILAIPDAADVLKKYTGGLDGLVGIPPPKLFGHELDANGIYVTVVVLAVAWLAFMRNFVRSRHGAALRTVRQSPVLAASLGINVARTKFTVYALGGIPAGIAGCLLASEQQFLSPGLFDFNLVIAVIAASVLGGSQSVYGAVLGAAVIQLGPMRATVFQDYALVAYGVFLVLFGVFLRGGAARLGTQLVDRVGAWLRRGRPSAERPSRRTEASGDPFGQPGSELEIRGISKNFGGVRALTDVSFGASPGRVTGLIGANGSGKTTLLNLVSGFYTPSAGSIVLNGRELQHRRPFRIARVGVARTFQTPQIPADVSVLEVVASARYTREYSGILATALRWPTFRRIRRADITHGTAVLRTLGIEHLAHEAAASLSLGNRRLVEIARAVAAQPALLLLDEPASGLDEAEVREFERVVRLLRDAGATVVLVEHNFRLICEVSDTIHVLDFGRVIASGTADEIRHDPVVARSYLGTSSSDVDHADAVAHAQGDEAADPVG